MNKIIEIDAELRADPRMIDLRQVVIDLEITSVCDAVCTFCPREAMPDKRTFMSMKVIERLASQLRETPALLVVLCGIGESTLHPRLDEIVRILSDAGARVEMTTHGGARLTPVRFEELVACGLSGFNISLNAATAETHRRLMKLRDFDSTVDNLQGILELRRQAYPHISVHVSCVVCDMNRHEVDDFVAFWRPWTPNTVWLHPVNNRNGLLASDVCPVDMESFAERYRGVPGVQVDIFADLGQQSDLCKIAKQLIFVSSDGEMRLCAMDYRRVTSYGNLARETILDMHRDKLARYLQGETTDFCRGCTFCPSGIGERAMAPGE